MIHLPHLRLEQTGGIFPLASGLTTVGRGVGVDIALLDVSVSPLHAEIHRHGSHHVLSDLGLSVCGTWVNGVRIGRRVLREGDIVTFGVVRTRVGALGAAGERDDTVAMRHLSTPHLTRREHDVLAALCRPALRQDVFVAPASTREVADGLVVTEAAVKQHLLRLYQKFRIGAGPDRRARLANEVISAGVVRPLPEAEVDLTRAAGHERVHAPR